MILATRIEGHPTASTRPKKNRAVRARRPSRQYTTARAKLACLRLKCRTKKVRIWTSCQLGRSLVTTRLTRRRRRRLLLHHQPPLHHPLLPLHHPPLLLHLRRPKHLPLLVIFLHPPMRTPPPLNHSSPLQRRPHCQIRLHCRSLGLNGQIPVVQLKRPKPLGHRGRRNLPTSSTVLLHVLSRVSVATHATHPPSPTPASRGGLDACFFVVAFAASVSSFLCVNRQLPIAIPSSTSSAELCTTRTRPCTVY